MINFKNKWIIIIAVFGIFFTLFLFINTPLAKLPEKTPFEKEKEYNESIAKFDYNKNGKLDLAGTYHEYNGSSYPEAYVYLMSNGLNYKASTMPYPASPSISMYDFNKDNCIDQNELNQFNMEMKGPSYITANVFD